MNHWFVILTLWSPLFWDCNRVLDYDVFFQIPFDGSRSLCHACWVRLERAVQNQPRPDEPLEQEQQQPQPVNPEAGQEVFTLEGYSRAANTSRRCNFEGCRNIHLRVVPSYVKFNQLHSHNYYIPPLLKVCQPHLVANEWDELRTQRGINDFNSAYMLDIINLYKWGLEKSNEMDFENIESVDDNELHFWTGVTKNQFHNILQQTPSLLDKTTIPGTVLAIYLMKIRTGDSDERLATKFKMSRRTLERKLNLTRECLIQDFVPLHLGLEHITREQAIDRTLTIPANFFGGDEETNIFVLDGTYLYIQKSSNFLFQRLSYSPHKYRNLIKPFLCVSTDGYIIDILGPYTAVTSDAKIMRTMMSQTSPWHWFLRPNDVLILDRGFRDSIPQIERCGYIAYMPPTARTQLTTAEANKSRLVTMTRWVVETINGCFKKDFKYFRHVLYNITLPHTKDDFRITAAIINATRKPYEDSEYADQFIRIINENINRENELAEYVQVNNLNRQRVAFVAMDANNVAHDFPIFTFEDLILFSLGTYHLRLARSYCHEHMRPDGLYILDFHRDHHLVNGSVLIRGRIQSRHVQRTQYYCYILYDLTGNGRVSVKGYYCSCKHGRRTIGSCAHVISIIYYLSWARHLDHMPAPAAFLDNITVPIDIDEAEEGSDMEE